MINNLLGTLEKFFPECSLDGRGMHMVIKAFSWPRGFASHLTAHVPGINVENGKRDEEEQGRRNKGKVKSRKKSGEGERHNNNK